jgi:hypothetical protein
MHLLQLAATIALSATPQDFMEGAEIGDATRYVAFETGGKYHAEKNGEQKGQKTVLKGQWSFSGENTMEVKQTSCTGKECKALQHPYKVELTVVAERAMTLKTTPNEAMLPAGSYYCRFQGCEQRIGIELRSKSAPASTMNYVLDFSIDKNRKRDQTVVWWAKKMQTDAGASRIETCGRDPERAKKGAELMQGDLAELPWIGKLEIKDSGETDCLWDVRVTIADNVVAPGRLKRN